MAKDNAHMNNQAGIRFPIAITNAGKRISGTASIQRLLSPTELGGWEIANGPLLYVPSSEFTGQQEPPQLAAEVSAAHFHLRPCGGALRYRCTAVPPRTMFIIHGSYHFWPKPVA